jgi:hypothetical protein
MISANTATIYHITVQGQLKEKWADWLNGLVVKMEKANNTTITVCVPDQAALRGILNKLWDLNLILISIMLQDEETTDIGNNTRHGALR